MRISRAYIKQDHKRYQHAFSAEKGGYGPASSWYRASVRGINEKDEKSMYHFAVYPVTPFHSSLVWDLSSTTESLRILLTRNAEIPTSAHTLTHPTLLIASTSYIITVTVNFAEQMRPFVPDLKVENVNGGHWLQLEKPDEVNKIMEEFVEAKRSI